MNSTPFPKKNEKTVNHFHFNFTLSKPIIEQNDENLSLVNLDHQENTQFVEENGVILDIPDNNKKLIEKSSKKFKEVMGTDVQIQKETEEINCDDLEKQYNMLEKSIESSIQGEPDLANYQSYFDEKESTISITEEGSRNTTGDESNLNLSDYLESLNKLSLKPPKNDSVKPKFKKASLKYLAKQDIGKKFHQSGFFSPVESRIETPKNKSKRHSLNDQYLLEDVVRAANTVRDFQKFQNIMEMPHSLTITGSNSKNPYSDANIKRYKMKIAKIKENIYKKCSFALHYKPWEQNYNCPDRNYGFKVSIDLDSSDFSPDRFSVESIEEVDEQTGQVVNRRVVFCNDRPVPRWAERMNVISAISRCQKNSTKAETIFGRFRSVKNLDLKEILNDYNSKYDIRGDSFYPLD